MGTTLIDYYSAKRIDQATSKRDKKKWLALSLFSNIGVLVAFKYSVFFINTILNSVNDIGNLNYNLLQAFVIPAGLSFYTFQSLSYTIDVYRGKYSPKDSLAFFALYVSFFPHMVAGPVVRYNSLMPQFYEIQHFKKIDWEAALKNLIWGFFKKLVIADRLAEIVDPIFSNVYEFSGSTLLLTGFLFVIQVYCDLSGYSDIATGLAKLFGINFSLNWRRPLLSNSLHDFWKRNHISITTWFKDYVYVSLGGNKCTRSRWLINIFIVFLISGLWHGANWTFVIWGFMHGLAYLIELVIGLRYPGLKIARIFGWFYLIAFHTLSLIAFRANNTKDLIEIYNRIFLNFNYNNCIKELHEISDYFPLLISVFLIVFLFLKEINEEFALLNNLKKMDLFIRPMFYVFVLLGILIFGIFNSNTFIYFQF